MQKNQEKHENKPNLIIFNSLLLPPSQTFIRDPAEKLQKFSAYYVGSRRVQGLALPPERTLVVNHSHSPLSKIEEQLFKLGGFAPKLYQQVRKLQPVLIHAQFGLSGALILPWMRSLNIPLLVHYRGADATVKPESARYTSLNHWIYFRRLEALKQETHLFLAVSNFIRDKLIEQNFPQEKIRVHYHGVDVDQFCPDIRIPREPIVLFVGRLTEKKGVEYLIQAMAYVQSTLPKTKLVIIGDGPLRSTLEKLAAQHLKHYEFLGFQSPEVVRSWMNQAMVLAAPSVTSIEGDSEGLPNVVLEAQAMLLPVVSTDHAGIPEAVIDGETGYLTAERDCSYLANRLSQLLENSELWQRLSRQGREHVEAHFNRAKQTQILETIYESILSNHQKF